MIKIRFESRAPLNFSHACGIWLSASLRPAAATILIVAVCGCSAPSAAPASGSSGPLVGAVPSASSSTSDPSAGSAELRTKLGPDDDIAAAGIGLTVPGALDVGTYTTEYFPAELSLAVPEGWSSKEDSTGEFALAHTGSGDADLLFWQDVDPVAFDGTPIDPVGPTAADLITWLKSNESLDVTEVGTAKVSGLTATVVDLEVAAGARNGDPNCPSKACVDLLSYPLWTERWGIAMGMGVRLWAIDRPYGNRLVIVAQTNDAASLPSFLKVAEPVLASVKLAA